jgi:exoribonuclease R
MRPITLRASGVFENAFDRIREELDVPTEFPTDVAAEAEAARPDSSERVDARHLPLVAIDPPGATDLDQAFAAQRLGNGYRVFYAIADLGAFLTPGGAVDTEARRRGTTLYCPDFRAPLHPTVISEDRASLLAGSEKVSLLWTIDLDESGEATDWRLERAVVRTREAISYLEAQRRIEDGRRGRPPVEGTVDQCLALLAEIGPLRQHLEADRGGVSLRLPAQEIARHGEHYVLEFDESLPIERWNAQISLLAGMVAGQTMFDAGVGILRTLPTAHDDDVALLRRTAAALGLNWNAEQTYADFVRDLHPTSAAQNAFLVQCTRLFKGAGYYGFNGTRPEHPEHGAIASVYSHVTAPLRRLVDRFGNEVLLALFAGSTPSSWAVEALDELPSLMGQARQRESSLERALLDATEALTLEHHVGETFQAVVVNINDRRSQATVQIPDPAVVAHVASDGLGLADHIKLRLSAVDIDTRSVRFAPVGR